MGLEPSPELIAVSIGEATWQHAPLHGCDGMVTSDSTCASAAGYLVQASQQRNPSTVDHRAVQTALSACNDTCLSLPTQGIKMSLGTLTEQYYLKDNLGFSPAQVRTGHGCESCYA